MDYREIFEQTKIAYPQQKNGYIHNINLMAARQNMIIILNPIKTINA